MSTSSVSSVKKSAPAPPPKRTPAPPKPPKAPKSSSQKKSSGTKSASSSAARGSVDCRPMTFEEKRALSSSINQLPRMCCFSVFFYVKRGRGKIRGKCNLTGMSYECLLCTSHMLKYCTIIWFRVISRSELMDTRISFRTYTQCIQPTKSQGWLR